LIAFVSVSRDTTLFQISNIPHARRTILVAASLEILAPQQCFAQAPGVGALVPGSVSRKPRFRAPRPASLDMVNML
jgi:hypothetical protein